MPCRAEFLHTGNWQYRDLCHITTIFFVVNTVFLGIFDLVKTNQNTPRLFINRTDFTIVPFELSRKIKVSREWGTTPIQSFKKLCYVPFSLITYTVLCSLKTVLSNEEVKVLFITLLYYLYVVLENDKVKFVHAILL